MEEIQTDYKPWGGLAGVYAGQQAANKEAMNNMAILQRQIDVDKAQQMSPLEVMIKRKEAEQAAALSDPEAIARYRAGQLGGFDSQAVKGRSDVASEGAETGKRIKEAMAATKKAEQQEILTGIENFLGAIQASGPAGIPAAMEGITDPNLRKAAVVVLQQQGPQGLVNLAKQVRDQIVQFQTDTAGQRQAKELEDVKGEWDIKKQKEHNKAIMAAASVKSAAEKSAEVLMDLRKIALGQQPTLRANQGVTREMAAQIIQQIRDETISKATAPATAKGEEERKTIDQILGKPQAGKTKPLNIPNGTQLEDGSIYLNKRN